MTSPVLDVHDLHVVDADGAAVLTAGTVAATPGQVVALVGASGSGKTTLLRAACGAVAPGLRQTDGAVRLLGRDLAGLDAEALRLLRRERVGYVGQDPASRLNPRMPVRRLLGEIGGPRSAGAVLDRVGLAPALLRRRPGRLSGGQQRLVALARALARQPALLLLDEPTAGMDPALRRRLGELLRTLATDDGLAIVMACHDRELVAGLADDVVELGAADRGGVDPGGPDGPSTMATTSERPVPGVGRAGLRSTAPDRAPAAGPDVLALRGLGVSVAGRPLLTGLSLGVRAGAAVAVFGESGTGKTTLVRALAGLHPWDGGEVLLAGQPLTPRVARRSAAQRRGIQLVPQDPLGTLNPSRTVGETVARPVLLHGLRSPAAVPARVRELLAQVGLPAEFADRRPAQLSGGQRQRVSVARALAAEPAVLLCDEVTSALDHDTARTIMDLLARLRVDTGLAVLMISHDVGLAGEYADTVLTVGR